MGRAVDLDREGRKVGVEIAHPALPVAPDALSLRVGDAGPTRESAEVDLEERVGSALDVPSDSDVEPPAGQGPLRDQKRQQIAGAHQALLHDGCEERAPKPAILDVLEGIHQRGLDAKAGWRAGRMHRAWPQSPTLTADVIIRALGQRPERNRRLNTIHRKALEAVHV